MPARLSCVSSSLKPRGSIRWRLILVAAQSRATLTVLGGISGSISTMCMAFVSCLVIAEARFSISSLPSSVCEHRKLSTTPDREPGHSYQLLDGLSCEAFWLFHQVGIVPSRSALMSQQCLYTSYIGTPLLR